MKKKIYLGTVISVIFILLCGIFVSLKDNKVADWAENIWQINSNIRKFYSNRPGFWGLSTQSAIDNKLVPSHMVQNGKLVSVYGKELKIGRGINADTVMPGTRGFDIVLYNLTPKECAETLIFDYKAELLLGVNSVSIISDKNTKVLGWEEKNALPLSKQHAKNICEENSTIIWHIE